MTMFDPAILRNNPAVRGRMLAILQAALDAVRPDLAVKAQLHRAGSLLSVAGETIDLAACRRIFVLGAGKAGRAHDPGGGRGARRPHYGRSRRGQGGSRRPDAARRAGRSRPSGANRGRASPPAPACCPWHETAQAGDLVIVLLSGGGSALLEEAQTWRLTSARRSPGTDRRTPRLRRDDRRDQLPAQASQPDQGRPTGPRRLSCTPGHPCPQRRRRQPPRRHRQRADRPRPDHLGRCLAYRRQVQPGRSPAAGACDAICRPASPV